MKTLYFDCFAGISGDMTLGALVDVGVDPSRLKAELEKLNLKGWKLDFVRDERCGISGTRAVVEIEGDDDHHDHHEYHNHEQHEHGHDDHEHDHHHSHDHEHSHEHHHDHHHEHSHNSWKEIRHVIETSAISDGAKRRALDIFSRIAKAESEVHGVPVDNIGFHEVGALDSIIDIVGVAICLDILAPARITAGTVELGGGTVRCAHGELPVPAPATLILCRGMPVHTGGFNKEMTTPTGAAILASQVDEFVSEASFTELKTGYGLGTRKLDKPNALRVSWRDAQDNNVPKDVKAGKCVLLETNVDDMTGEELGFLMERLFDSGAHDVVFIPCIMKKNRPGTLVSVLCPPDKLEVLQEIIFTQSKTIGFREIPARCFALRRESESLAGAYGGTKKTVYYAGEKLRDKVEFEDKADLARQKNISLWDAEKLLRGNHD
ncbi:UPF0272 protein [Spirochaetia bacterium]|nr:UPF0272 protein [Spirochaetia bacterium]